MFEIKILDNIRAIEMAHGKVNALDLEFCLGLTSTLHQLSNDSSCAGVVLTARGRVFSAGVDLKRLIDEEKSYLEEFLPALIELFTATFCFPKPLVAAINGHAIAGGCVLATACDYRILTPQAKIGIPELRVGVPFPPVAIEIMRTSVAPGALQRMVNIGSTYTGEVALSNGLADELVERDTQPEVAYERLRQLVDIPAKVFAITKEQLHEPAMARIAAGRAAFEDRIFQLWQSDEIRDVIRAFVSQRL